MAKLIIFVLTLFTYTLTFSQTIKGVVMSAKDKEPLAFSSISYSNKKGGTITNINGEFLINTNKDSLLVTVYYLGYHKCNFWLKKNIKNNIYLKQQNYILNSVTVNGYTNKRIADIIMQIKNQITDYKDEIEEAKAITRTFTIKNKRAPIEINEINYSAELSLSNIKDLYVKSGKFGFNNNEKTNYYSLDIATIYLKNISFFTQRNHSNITNSVLLSSYYNKRYKDIYNLNIPLSYNQSKDIENDFKLSYNEIDEKYAVINFYYKDSLTNGKIFYNKTNYEIKKIIVNKINQNDLFISINPNTEIKDTKIHIEANFKLYNEKQVLDFIYIKLLDIIDLNNKIKNDTLETHFTADFYNYGNSFFIPFYGIERDFNDYEGIVITGNKSDLKTKNMITKTEKESQFYNSLFNNNERKKINAFKYISVEEITDTFVINWKLLKYNTLNKFKINQFIYCDYYKTKNNTYIFDTKAFIDYSTSYFTFDKDNNATGFIKGLLEITKSNSEKLKIKLSKKYGNEYVSYYKIRKELAKTYRNIEYEKQKYIKTNKEKLKKYPVKSSPHQ